MEAGSPEAGDGGNPHVRSCTGQGGHSAAHARRGRRSGGEAGSLRQDRGAGETDTRPGDRRNIPDEGEVTAHDIRPCILRLYAGCRLHEEGVRGDSRPPAQPDRAGAGTENGPGHHRGAGNQAGSATVSTHHLQRLR